MIERVEERFALKPERLIGDMAYGTAEMLGWMVDEKQIEPHVPVWDRTQRDDETLSSSDFNGTNRPTNTAAHRASRCGANGGSSRACERTSPRPTPSSISQPSRLQQVPDEVTLLSEHTDSEDRSQRP